MKTIGKTKHNSMFIALCMPQLPLLRQSHDFFSRRSLQIDGG